ncbi:MAG: NEW3 domain-containing protein, partial [Candidatus Bipolaricaulaceae bacterium]
MKWAVICALAVGLAAGQLGAQGVVVTVASPPRAVQPGDIATFVLSLANATGSGQAVELAVELPPGWSLLGAVPSVFLPSGGEDVVFFAVAVPRTAAAGDYAVELAARWDGDQAQAQALVSVEAVAGVALSSPPGQAVLPGQEVSYQLQVHNHGNVLDRFRVRAVSVHNWPLRVAPRELALVPGEGGAVEVTVSVPQNAAPERDLLTVTVESVSEPAVGAQATTFTTVLPPTPGRVTGTHLAELDTRLEAQLSGDLVSGARSWVLAASALGSVLDGELAFDAEWRGPAGPGGWGLEELSFVYVRETARAAGGDVSLAASPLVAVGGRGVAVDWGGEVASLAFLSGWEDGEACAGARVEVTLSGAGLGGGWVHREGAEKMRVLAAWGSWEPAAGLALRVERGWAGGDPPGSDALWGTVTATGDPLLFRLDAFSVGPGFPTWRAATCGVSVAGRVVADPLSWRLSAQHFVDQSTLTRTS